MVPGICLQDPISPGECLNKPFPGQGSFDVRAYADTSDVGYSNSIVTTFESDDEGFFRVGLPSGEYCVWMEYGCEAQVAIIPRHWLEITLQVYLP